METKVIAIEWSPNCGKSTLIKNTAAMHDDLNILLYPETAREVMKDYPWSENNQDMFQEIIYHRESERLYKLEQDVKSWLYDAIIIDRSSLSWWIFWMYNEDKWVSTKLRPTVYKPDSYDNLILFTKPMWTYNWSVDAFNWYNNPELNELFKKYIPQCYKNCVSYENYLNNMREVDQYVYNVLKWK